MVTVEKIMQLDIVKNQMKLLGGEKGLGKQIDYITIMEAPDFYEWVSGGELVLTSWYSYSQNPKGQEHAFSELAKKVSAIGIKVDRFLDKVPQVLIDLANEYQVPLFSIKRETKFREVIFAVSAEVQNAQTNILLKVERYYNELIKSALASDDFSQVLLTTNKHMHKSVFCLNSDGKYLGGYFSNDNKDNFNEDSAKDFYKKYIEDKLQEQDIKTRVRIDGFDIFPCIARRRLLGFFVIKSEQELQEPDILIAQQTISVLALKLLEGYESLQKRLIQLIEDIKRNVIIPEKLDNFGLKWRKKHLYVACLKGKTNNILDLFAKTNFLKNTDNLLTIVQTNSIVFIGATSYDVKDDMPLAIQHLVQWIEKECMSIVLSISPKSDNIQDLTKNFFLANDSADAALFMDNFGCVQAINWLLPSIAVKQLDSYEIKQIKESIVKPILEYDLHYKAELLNTLKVVLQTSKNELAARKLHIHVNTLRYRLQKIRDLTGLDTTIPAHLSVLFAAFIVSNIDKKN